MKILIFLLIITLTSPSEFSDIEPEVFDIIDEMEMTDRIYNIFNEVMNYFSDTPLHDVPQNIVFTVAGETSRGK